MGVEELVRLIDSTDDAGRLGVPSRAAVEELAHQGRIDQLLLLVTSQELHRLHVRVLRWQEDGRPCERPLTHDDIRRLQARGRGACICEGVPIPAYIAESYRAFLLWYGHNIADS